ncbi:hypothetical protein HMPREF9624_00550 [Oribacterium asaccharolyticum ACB7]|uniref:TIR domain-containing protein n=1 Tax=Oribacterium asaccharolyticum ACB7 TaxID=796944 RepID=G9WU40_9FIRM|nr:hypothetical protein [Oribacterium asaccharolyticum]EHL12243.1 hypothetical protein HMPREF9624_00550 [Oribacterium asaccharolyticum ACB7]
MILTNEFLSRESVKRDISNASETRILNENYAVFSQKESYDLFISHSFFDKKLILTLIDLFNNADYSVYVDWINDKTLDRNNVSPKTAKVIKNRISDCKGLSYIATGNITNSKWCPWELGLADGMLNGRSCILPVMEETVTFKGLEYLGLYPFIEYEKVRNKNIYEFWVIDQGDSSRYVSLRNWLNGATLERH